MYLVKKGAFTVYKFNSPAISLCIPCATHTTRFTSLTINKFQRKYFYGHRGQRTEGTGSSDIQIPLL